MKFQNYPVSDFGPPLTEKMLNEFEKMLPRPLPTDYRAFMTQYNGGYMDEEKNSYYVQGVAGFTKTRPGDEGGIEQFTSLDLSGSIENELSADYLSYKDEGVFPEHCLPIGDDGCGNLTLMSLGEEDYGHIYYWDHENGWDERGSLEPDYSHCYFAANSFTEFINSLHASD